MTPVKLTLSLPDGAELVMGSAAQELGHLAGRDERTATWSPWLRQWNTTARKAELLVRVRKPSLLQLTAAVIAPELKFMVKMGVVTDNLAALRSITAVAARVNRLEHKLGTLEAGRESGLIVIDGNPAANLDDIARVEQTYIAGKQMLRVENWARLPVLFGPHPLPLFPRGEGVNHGPRRFPASSARGMTGEGWRAARLPIDRSGGTL